MSDIDVGIDQTDHISFFCPDCAIALTVTDVGTSEVVVNTRTDERDQCTWIHTYCGQCKAVKGHRKFYWTSDDGNCTERMSTMEAALDQALKRVASVEAFVEANRVAALEAIRQWREVAERLDAWVHALAPRVESHPHEYDDNLVHAVTEFDRLSKGQP